MFKRFISLVLALSCIMLPVSLTQAQDDGIDWSAELGDWSGKTLKVVMIQDPWIGAVESVAKGFEELTGATVVIDGYGYDQTHEKEVLIGTSESSDYDVVVLDAPWVGEFAEGGFLEDLQPYIDATDPEVIAWDDYLETPRAYADWKGMITGMPFAPYFMLTHYRADLFEEAGLPAPETIEDFQAAAAALTDEDSGFYGLAMNNQRGAAAGQMWFEWLYNMGGKPFESEYPGSPDAYADMTPLMDSPEGIATTQFFIDMLQYEPIGAENIAWDERAALFSTGQIAMATIWVARTPGIANPEQSIVVDTFDTVPFPHKAGEEAVANPVGGWLMGINTYSEQKEMAWDFIKWFTSPEVHREFALAGGLPARYSVLEDPEVVAVQPWLPDVLEVQAGTYADNRPRIPESFQIIDIVGFHVSQAIQGQVTAEEAMKAADEEVAQLLKDAGYTVNQ